MEKQLQSLIDDGFISNSVVPLDLSRVVSISEFTSWDWETKESKRDSLMLVCDNATWAVAELLGPDGRILAGTTIHSGDGTDVGRHIRRSKFGMYKVDSRLGLVNSSGFIPLYNKTPFREEKKLADNIMDMNVSDDELAKLMAGDNKGGQTDLQSFDNNGGEGSKQEKGAPTVDPAVAEVRKITQSVNIQRYTKLDRFNRENGSVIGYITANDRRVMPSVSLRVLSRDQLLPSASNDEKIASLHASNQKSKIPGKNYPHEFAISFRESKPGKVLSVVVEVAPAGIVDINDLRNAETMVNFDSEDTTKQKMSIRFSDFFAFMGFYFPNGIKEAKQTHGELASELYVQARVKNADKDNGAIDEYRTLVTRNRKGSYLLPTNYFPIHTFKTVSLDKQAFTPEEEQGLNISAFYTLVKPKNNNNDRFQRLDRESQAMFADVSNPDNIKSTVFAAGIGQRTAIEVASFHNKDVKMSVVEFPVKRLVPLKDQENQFRAEFVRISCVNDEVIATRNPLSSLYSEKFAAIREAFGPDVLSVDNLKLLSKRSGKGPSAPKDMLNADDLRKLQLLDAYSQTGMNSNVGDSLKDIHGLSERLRGQLI